uniref:Uncharacterized protein n=1 Tax=Anguilla anguilla TaxID=7936 RepID=A0A0E9WPZ8_ANGAN
MHALIDFIFFSFFCCINSDFFKNLTPLLLLTHKRCWSFIQVHCVKGDVLFI